MRHTRFQKNVINDYVIHGREIRRQDEVEWVTKAKNYLWYVPRFSDRTLSWLKFQNLTRSLVSASINGISTFDWTNPRDWISLVSNRWWKYSLRQDNIELLQKFGLKNVYKDINVYVLKEFLSQAERILKEPPSEIFLNKTTINIKNALPAEHKVGYLHKYCYGLSEYLSLYIHGSMATGDYTSFSDVDDLLILHFNAWRDLDVLKHILDITVKISRTFQDIDPLQHHGHWVYTELDLLCFDESIIPLVVLESAQIVCGKYEIEVASTYPNNMYGFRNNLWSIIQEVRREAMYAWNSGRINLYSLKNLISGISLLPALVFQNLGQMIEKKTAILNKHRIYSEEACIAVEWASEIREKWNEMPMQKNPPITRILLKPIKNRHFMERIIQRTLSPISHSHIPKFAEVVPLIFKLTDESANWLRKSCL